MLSSSTSPEAKTLVLHIINHLAESQDAKVEIGRLQVCACITKPHATYCTPVLPVLRSLPLPLVVQGFKKILQPLLLRDPTLTREVLNTLRIFLDTDDGNNDGDTTEVDEESVAADGSARGGDEATASGAATSNAESEAKAAAGAAAVAADGSSTVDKLWRVMADLSKIVRRCQSCCKQLPRVMPHTPICSTGTLAWQLDLRRALHQRQHQPRRLAPLAEWN